MNKMELVEKISEATGSSKTDAAKFVDAFSSVIGTALKEGEEVRLVGFGTFSVGHRAASDGRNPRTGESIKIPASKQPKFKAGKALKDLVNGKPKA